MPLRISRVLKGSIAEAKGLREGDVIISINGKPINDFIGLQYHGSEQELLFILEDQDKNRKEVLVTQDWHKKLGIVPEDHKVRECCNHCIFCFIDQMPPNQRGTLYLKDDDYLFSFIYGNYISLSNLTKNDYQRIINERISPLYISVHTTDSILRKDLMGYRQEINILERLSFLSDNGIGFHTQIVVIPEHNDGNILLQSLNDLINPSLKTLSIGIVPVGLTRHRKALPRLKAVDSYKAKEIITTAEEVSHKNGFPMIYCADELFILAEKPIPSSEYYQDFCQIENGIGMIRAMKDNWRKKKKSFIKSLHESSILFVTGKIAEKSLKDIADNINRITKVNRADVLAVENEFFGKSVTVSGLLTFQDIRKQLVRTSPAQEIIAFSSNMFNSQGYTIDNVLVSVFQEQFNKRVLIVDELWNNWQFL